MAIQILTINGANMNTLGKRDAGALGNDSLDMIMKDLGEYASACGVEMEFLQSNHEGVIIEAIQQAPDKFQGIIINPGSYGHYSYGIKEAIGGVDIPVIEVHLANFFRKPENRSVLASVCKGVVCGFGAKSYQVALDGLIKIL